MIEFKIVAYLNTIAIWAYYTEYNMTEELYYVKGDMRFIPRRSLQSDWRLLW